MIGADQHEGEPNRAAGLVPALEAIRLGRRADDRTDAVEQVGRTLIDIGAVAEDYLGTMHQREAAGSTYIGEGVAIPHGTDESRAHVHRSAVAVVQFPEGVDWGGEDVRLCVGIAVMDSEHVSFLASLARVLIVPDQAERLRSARDARSIIQILRSTVSNRS
ncbi:PTS sugar transporter subunit IIA [Kibdelosporangium aridum]|uniref:PTS sugar transporter subunit IIA n=1 Tax=Kibdelosporangium aridum TaxID=2030 RepID=UPI000B1456F5